MRVKIEKKTERVRMREREREKENSIEWEKRKREIWNVKRASENGIGVLKNKTQEGEILVLSLDRW